MPPRTYYSGIGESVTFAAQKTIFFNNQTYISEEDSPIEITKVLVGNREQDNITFRYRSAAVMSDMAQYTVRHVDESFIDLLAPETYQETVGETITPQRQQKIIYNSKTYIPIANTPAAITKVLTADNTKNSITFIYKLEGGNIPKSNTNINNPDINVIDTENTNGSNIPSVNTENKNIGGEIIMNTAIPYNYIPTNIPGVYYEVDENNKPLGYFTQAEDENGNLQWVEVDETGVPLHYVNLAIKNNPKTGDYSRVINFGIIFISLLCLLLCKDAVSKKL